jgi:tetratricopeptide (TPR) repeat protein
MAEARIKNYSALICFVLGLGTVLLYWPLTQHPFIVYDDGQYIIENVHVTSGLSWQNFRWAFTSGEAANWHPLTWLSHQLDCTLFGLNAGGHHFTNVLFHAANAVLVFIFLRGATGAIWRSAVVAALFAWHPLHVESVAWASERKDVLSTFFWLLTLLTYIRYARYHRWPAYAATLLLFACGLMSKPMVVTLPFVLLLLDYWPLRRIPNSAFQISDCKWLLLEKIPFFLLAAAGSTVTYLVQTGGGALWPTPWPDRMANAAIAYARYVAKTFWPSDLAIIYSHPNHWPVIMALGATLALLAWTILCLREWRTKPFLAVGWFWFLGTLVPTIGFVQVGAQAMADRYTYIPSIGLFIVLVWGTTEFLARSPNGKVISKMIAGVALVGCVLMLSFQISFWRDSVTLFRRAIEVSPDNYAAANGLGKAYENLGDLSHAVVLYRAAVELEPRFPQSQFNYAMTLLQMGNGEEGFKHLETAAEMMPNNPKVQFYLGAYNSQQGNWTNAVKCLRITVKYQPDFQAAQELLKQILTTHPELN